MSDLIGIGLGAVSTGVSQGLGMINQGQQVKDQRGLMEHGANLAYRNWLRTNYGAQREQLEKAGMNVGLMYSQGGQGGQLNGGSSGSASQAPTFDVASAISQAKAVESQVNLNEAQANKLNVEAKKLAGVDTDKVTTEIASLSQGIQNQKAQEKLTDMETNLKGVEYDLKNATLNDSIGIVRNELNAGLKQIYILEQQGIISKEEANASNEKWRLELAGMGLKNALTKAQEDNTIQMTKESRERIMQKWKELDVNTFKAEVEAEFPGLTKVIGKSLNEIYDMVGSWSNRDENERVRKVE